MQRLQNQKISDHDIDDHNDVDDDDSFDSVVESFDSVNLSPKEKAIAQNVTQKALLVFFLTVLYCIWSSQAVIGILPGKISPDTYNHKITWDWILFTCIDFLTYILLPLCVWLSMPFTRNQYECMCGICDRCCHRFCHQWVDQRLARPSSTDGRDNSSSGTTELGMASQSKKSYCAIVNNNNSHKNSFVQLP